MSMWLVMAIYYYANRQPFMGTIFYTVGYATKTGALLMLPAILGCLQYNHGTINLVVCVILIRAI